MREKLKKLILSRIKASGKKPEDISTFTIPRANNGMYNIKIYWKGKTKPGDTRAIIIDLTFKIDLAQEAIFVLDQIMTEAKNIEIDFDQKLQTEVNTQTEKDKW